MAGERTGPPSQGVYPPKSLEQQASLRSVSFVVLLLYLPFCRNRTMQAPVIRTTHLAGLTPSSVLCQRPQRSLKRQPLVLTRAEPEGSSEPPAPEQKPKTSYYVDELPEVRDAKYCLSFYICLIMGRQ